MRVLIVDDDTIKLKVISQIIPTIISNPTIEIAEYGMDALRKMKLIRYDLLILDINLPYKENDSPNSNGGKQVVQEIYRKLDSIYVPNYLVGLTQYKEFINDYFSVWNVIHYSSNDSTWIGSLKKLLTHISYVTYEQIDNSSNKPAVLLEGVTDFIFLEKAIEFYEPGLLNQIDLKYAKKVGGAQWVLNQAIVWMNMYPKDAEMKYVKAVALLDNDFAGNEVKNEILKSFSSENQRKLLKVLTLDCEYSNDILNLYRIGLKIPFEIESLFPVFCWEHAIKEGWTENRKTSEFSIPKNMEWLEESLKDYIVKCNLSEDSLMYLKKINRESKKNFSDYILSIPENRDIYKNFVPLIEDIKKKLEI
ncbi:response regulator [Nonlabens xiamenensis]|uniref:response regulator n=1 Tax=Nonlabens xiamenensis TaxID=2341043 RepID=UPI000F60E3BE|nr:response regulator [Nonlabens xiamenensis]